MSDTRKDIVLRQLRDSDAKQKKLRQELKELEKKELVLQRKERQKREKRIGQIIHDCLSECFGTDYFQSMNDEQVRDYLMRVLQMNKETQNPQESLEEQIDAGQIAEQKLKQEDEDIAW